MTDRPFNRKERRRARALNRRCERKRAKAQVAPLRDVVIEPVRRVNDWHAEMVGLAPDGDGGYA